MQVDPELVGIGLGIRGTSREEFWRHRVGAGSGV